MKKFVRGGSLLAVLCMCVVFIYAQTAPTEVLSSTNDSKNSKTKIESKASAELKLNNNTEVPAAFIGDNDDKKAGSSKVKKTVSSRSTAAGKFTATAYCLKGKTALGHGVRRGLIAADPRVLKLGSRIQLSAGSYSGEYLVSDTGGAVKGRKIDIWMPSCAEARRFGRRTVSIN